MIHPPTGPWAVAVPDALVVKPLLSGLDARRDLAIEILPYPAVSETLSAGRCACALLSPTALLDNDAISVVPGAGVIARGAAPSERLITAAPLEAIRRIEVPHGTEHLVTYVQVLFAERGIPLPTLQREGAAGFTNPADGRLVSGAPLDRGEQEAGFDLGALWMETTELPMVLAVWACGPGSPYRMLRHVLGDAARRGEEALLSEADPHEAESLLREHYYYRLLSQETDSIRCLLELTRRHAISETTVEAIAFC